MKYIGFLIKLNDSKIWPKREETNGSVVSRFRGVKAVSINPTADAQSTPLAMRKFTLLLLLLAGLIAAVTTAPVPAPNPHHGGKQASNGTCAVISSMVICQRKSTIKVTLH